jgi:MoaA/NifB/PqqE/SkfB family radical SAM enzyme
MKIDDITMFDVEITSECNAACPMCAREMFKESVVKRNITLTQFKKAFPTELIKNKNFEFSGVLGDAIKNPECFEIVEYVLQSGSKLLIDTNGGYQTEHWWKELGILSKKFNNNLKIRWAIDGFRNTNHIYRQNTKFDIILRNLNAYISAAEAPLKHNVWSFILFDHNLCELDEARDYATSLGLQFQTRQSHRNSIKTNLKKNNSTEIVINTSTSLNYFLKNVYPTKKTEEIKLISKIFGSKFQELKTINCRFYHEKNLFVGSDYRVWPCCFIWDEIFANRKNINEKYKEYGDSWNDLEKHSLEEILNHEYYQKILKDSWDETHPKHLQRCIRTCLKNKRNIVTDE